ncbi:glycosyltransferase family 2 protein [Patescibacteria group bacterium]|nr:glycosyltransferase family 2 protein [Patescibacteria group bacterium]
MTESRRKKKPRRSTPRLQKETPRLKKSLPKCYVLVRGRNAEAFVERCLESILNQTYKNVTILFVDDASDYTKEVRKRINHLLRDHVVVWRKERYFSVRNAYEMITTFCDDPDGVVVNVDADDWLAHRTALKTIIQFYKTEHCLFSYGNCYVWQGQDLDRLPIASEVMPACNIPYSKDVIKNRTFRSVPFLIYHPRTWKVAAFKSIPLDAFKRSDGHWLQFCEDQAIFFPLLEMYPKQWYFCPTPLSVYNQANISADIKLHRLETLRDEIEIRRKTPYAPVSI